MSIPNDLKYTKQHEWVRIDGDVATVGITDHAQHSLGDIVFIELPKIGSTVVATKYLGVIESVKAAADIYSPVSGEVMEVNQDLEGQPEIINNSPYEQGWMAKIKVLQPENLPELMDAASYQTLLENHSS
jgi:glycine cleavage system H protein